MCLCHFPVRLFRENARLVVVNNSLPFLFGLPGSGMASTNCVAVAASILLMRQTHEHHRQGQRHIVTTAQNQTILRQQATLHQKLEQLHQLLTPTQEAATHDDPPA